MTDGIDQGPCFFYARLSYRRKFIRTCWFSPAALLLLIVLQASGYLPDSLWDYGLRHAAIGWLLIGIFALLFLAQGHYTYWRWRQILRAAE
jgi:hypothetical protein